MKNNSEKRKYTISGKYKIKEGKFKCEICGKQCDSLRSLEAHLRKAHFGHDILKFEEYYNKYIKSPEEGICIVCGKPTHQYKFKYDKCCSETCSAKYAVSCRKDRDAELKCHLRYDKLFENQIKNGLHIDITAEDIISEYHKFRTGIPSLSVLPNRNKCVLYFQQDNFYKNEKKLFSENPEIRYALIENREKYLFKPTEKISDYELLRGFKISGLYQTYSHFSPMWTKYFAYKYNIKNVADPFGGWGHHMLGFAAAGCMYYYNDLSKSTVEGVRQMNDFFKFGFDIHEGDAATFEIPKECDAVFMCPPYFNTEIYECGEYKSFDEYAQTLSAVVNNWKNSNANILGIIMREDIEILPCFSELNMITKESVNTTKSHFNKKRKMREFLYVYKKC